jgi:hypothetical protein
MKKSKKFLQRSQNNFYPQKHHKIALFAVLTVKLPSKTGFLARKLAISIRGQTGIYAVS